MAPRQTTKGQSKQKKKVTASESSEKSTATKTSRSRLRRKVKEASDHGDRDEDEPVTKTKRESRLDESKPDKNAGKENAAPTLSVNKRVDEPEMYPPITPVDLHSTNIVHRLHRHTTGQLFRHTFRQATVQSYAQQLSEYRVSQALSPFNRRVTALEWHPTHPTMLAVGSKGGDLMLWDYTKGQDGGSIVQGIGPGGNIASLHISRNIPDQIYSASLDGQVRLQNFEGNVLHMFKNTMDWRLVLVGQFRP